MRVSLLLISFIPFALLADDPCLNIQYSEAVFLCSKKTSKIAMQNLMKPTEHFCPPFARNIIPSQIQARSLLKK